MPNVLIAIQARSNSTRLPNKVHKLICGKPLIQWVIDNCRFASQHIKKDAKLKDTEVFVCLAVPQGDPLYAIYSSHIPVVQGDEKDVLKRYALAAAQFKADFVVRVTGDCIFLPPHLIIKHIKTAVVRNRDYVTNVMIRTFKEGLDCEVLSARFLKWLYQNAKTDYDREHVTTFVRDANGSNFPYQDFDGLPNIAHILNRDYDESDEKTSIDTEEDLKRAIEIIERFQAAKYKAKKLGTWMT